MFDKRKVTDHVPINLFEVDFWCCLVEQEVDDC